MPESNPFDVLSRVADSTAEPDPEFAERLLGQLFRELDIEPDSVALDLEAPTADDADATAPSPLVAAADGQAGRHKGWWLAAAAAALIVVAIGLASVLGGDDNTLITDEPTTPTTVAPSTTNVPTTSSETEASTTVAATVTTVPIPAGETEPPDVNVLQQALSAASQDLTVATIPERHPWNMVTFDPLDPERVLLADTLGDFIRFDFEPTSPELWNLADPTNTAAAELPWYAETGGAPGGIFQPDGSIFAGIGEDFTDVILLDNDGEFVSQRRISRADEGPVAQFPSGFSVSEDGTTAALMHNFSECPYRRVSVFRAGENEADIVDNRNNAFARMMIVEPGVAVAFPYLPDKENCEPLEATTAQAWDLATAQPLADHVFTGLEIARGTISADRRRALILSPDGTVTVLSTRDRSTTSTIASGINAGRVHLPLALNADGTLAGIAEDDGRFTLWHVDSGTLLLELASDPRPGPIHTGIGLTEPDYLVGAQLSYDLRRVALLDDTAGEWQIITLDPTDWLARACDNGLEIDGTDLGNITLPENC